MQPQVEDSVTSKLESRYKIPKPVTRFSDVKLRDGGCQHARQGFHRKGKARRNVSKFGLKIIHALGFPMVLRQEQ